VCVSVCVGVYVCVCMCDVLFQLFVQKFCSHYNIAPIYHTCLYSGLVSTGEAAHPANVYLVTSANYNEPL